MVEVEGLPLTRSTYNKVGLPAVKIGSTRFRGFLRANLVGLEARASAFLMAVV